MNLKTLKDLNIWETALTGDLVKIKELKDEAVKWVKGWKIEKSKSTNSQEVCYLNGKIDAIIELNNITEEDLE